MAFEIVAHRGETSSNPENSLAAFEGAVEMGADAVELDVRLTADHVAVVYHYFYLSEGTTGTGIVPEWTYADLQHLRLVAKDGVQTDMPIPTLREVLQQLAGRIGIEIEIKGPEPEAPGTVAAVLADFRSQWESFEVTSYEPVLLVEIQRLCPGLASDLLLPRSEPWMGPEVVSYLAVQRGRLCSARAVHLHPSQLCESTVHTVRQAGFEVHAWDTNSPEYLELAAKSKIPRLDTDRLSMALKFRSTVQAGPTLRGSHRDKV
jgi:glycerophosphoryl diester phosphodiesterase